MKKSNYEASCLTDQPVHLSEALRPELFEHKALEQRRSHPLAMGQAPCPHLGCSGRIHRSPFMQRRPAGCPRCDGRCLALVSSSTSWTTAISPARHRQGRRSWLPGCRRSGLSPFSMPGALHDDTSRHELQRPPSLPSWARLTWSSSGPVSSGQKSKSPAEMTRKTL